MKIRRSISISYSATKNRFSDQKLTPRTSTLNLRVEVGSIDSISVVSITI